MGVIVDGAAVTNFEEYQRAVQNRKECDDQRPYAAVIMLADSQMLFKTSDEGIAWIERVRCELPSRALTYDGYEHEVHASYVGTANGDIDAFFEIFCSAMDKINITNCMHIHADNPTPAEREHLELSDIILIAGGREYTNYRFLSDDQYLASAIKWRYYSGAVVIGVAEGCRFLGQKFWTGETETEAIMQTGLSIVPVMVNTGCNESETLAVVKQNGFGTVAIHIPKGSGMIFNTDGHLEAVGSSLLSEIHHRYEDGEPAITNYIAPPETGDGILVRMKQLRSRELNKMRPAVGEFVDDPDCGVDDDCDEIFELEAEELKQIGTEAFVKGRYPEALSLYEKSLKKNNKSIATSMNITLCLLRLGKLTDALCSADYTLSLPRGGEGAKSWYRRAMVFKELWKRTPDSEEHRYQCKCDLQQACSLSPQDATILEELSSLGDSKTPQLPVTFTAQDEGCLSGVRVRTERIPALETIVINNNGLHLLDLSKCMLGADGASCLFKRRDLMLNITKINLSGNKIPDTSIEEILAGLQNSTVRDINLSHNSLTFHSISKIAAFLKDTQSILETVDLSCQRPRLTAVSLWRLVPILFIEQAAVRDIYLSGLPLTAAAKQRLRSLQLAATNRCHIHCNPTALPVV